MLYQAERASKGVLMKRRTPSAAAFQKGRLAGTSASTPGFRLTRVT